MVKVLLIECLIGIVVGGVGLLWLCGGVQAAMWWVAHNILVSAPGEAPLVFELIGTWLGFGD